jgi:Na+/phosphate symporter
MVSATAELLSPMFQDTMEMLALTCASYRRHDAAGLELAAAIGRSVHKREKDLTERLLAGDAAGTGLTFVPGHLERVGDAIEGLLRCLRTMWSEGTVFTERGTREINQLMETASELLECARDVTLTRNRVLAQHVELESLRFHDMASDFARAHEERLIEGVCLPKASSTYLAMVDYLREIVRHARRIGARMVPPPPPTTGRVSEPAGQQT